MLKKIKFSLLAAALVSVGATAIANDALENAVKARKAHMQLYAYQLGQLGAMAKGAVDYNAEAAQTAADNLVVLTTLNGMSMWLPGSDSTAMPGNSRAKAEIWMSGSEIGKESVKLRDAIAELAAKAGNGLDDLRAGLGPVGGSCKSCHESYRAPKS